ncbi:hypothetical protein [Fusibacter sp. JL216-2]|uniref:hypothetical protein n=1 Tax=Fusibacter sp. JL216-2 TaxID=3071453 RepID=UPI003D3584C2
MIYEKLIELSNHYSAQERSNEEIEAFCNQFDVIYSNFSDELEKECSKEVFSLLDEIFMLCDSFEPNKDILAEEPYCIDEKELQRNLKVILSKIEKL